MMTKHSGSLAMAVIGVVCLWISSAAMAQAGGAASSTSAPATRSTAGTLYELMVQELNITDEQKPLLKEKTDALSKVQAEYNTKMAELTRNYMAAQDSKDDEKIKAAKEDLMNGIKTNSEKVLPVWKEVLAVLTAPQRVQWEARNFKMGMMARLRAATLTDEQLKKIDEIAQELGKAIAGLEAPKDNTAISDAYQAANKKVLELLTPEQKASLPAWAFPTSKPAASKPSDNGGTEKESDK